MSKTRIYRPQTPIDVDLTSSTTPVADTRAALTVEFGEIGFEGTVPAPYLLLGWKVLLNPRGAGSAELVSLDCTVQVSTPNGYPRLFLGCGGTFNNSVYLGTMSQVVETRGYLHVPVNVGALHLLEKHRRDAVQLHILLKVGGRAHRQGGLQLEHSGLPLTTITLSRDDWLFGLDAWGYTSTWVVEVPAIDLDLPAPVRRHLERAVRFLRQNPDDAVHAVGEVRKAMDAARLGTRLSVLEKAALDAKSDRSRSRVERLELLRGALWHSVNTALHVDGEDFQGWTRKEAELAVRALCALLASL